MVYGNKENLFNEDLFDKKILECFKYAKEHDLSIYEQGKHEIDGEKLFVNIAEYKTTETQDRFWEAHRYYLDLHLMLSGREQIDIALTHRMKAGEFVADDDFLPLEGEKSASVILGPGDFLICYPDDAHRTAVKIQESEKIKKAIFKIKIG